MLGANAVGDLKFNLMFIYYSKNSRVHKNYAKSTQPVLYKGNYKGWGEHICLQHGLTNILSLLLRPTTQEKKIRFKILLLIDHAPSPSRALMEMYKKINVVFMLANSFILHR